TFSEFLALNCIAFEFNVPRTKSNIKPVKHKITSVLYDDQISCSTLECLRYDQTR
ncbi:unnamed protein product, partial [Ascophyllum nodosum]